MKGKSMSHRVRSENPTLAICTEPNVNSSLGATSTPVPAPYTFNFDYRPQGRALRDYLLPVPIVEWVEYFPSTS